MSEEGGALGDEVKGVLFGESLTREKVHLSLNITAWIKQILHRPKLGKRDTIHLMPE